MLLPSPQHPSRPQTYCSSRAQGPFLASPLPPVCPASVATSKMAAQRPSAHSGPRPSLLLPPVGQIRPSTRPRAPAAPAARPGLPLPARVPREQQTGPQLPSSPHAAAVRERREGRGLGRRCQPHRSHSLPCCQGRGLPQRPASLPHSPGAGGGGEDMPGEGPGQLCPNSPHGGPPQGREPPVKALTRAVEDR